MVDFQSRDTRRGFGSDDEDEDEDGEEDDPDPAADADADAETAAHEAEQEGGASARADDPDSDASADDPLGSGPGTEDDHSHEDHSHDDHTHDDHGHDDHSHDHGHGLDVELLGVAVVTVSSTRSLEDDPSGDVVQAVVEGGDHEVVTRELIRDEFDGIQSTVMTLVGRGDVDAVVLTGGTGVTPDDVTVEAVGALFDKELPGFGELFRLLSYEEVGTKVVATRATAGIVDGVPVFALPGSENAAHLGTEEVILPEIEHLVGLAGRDD